MEMLDLKTFVSVEENDLAEHLSKKALTLLNNPVDGLLDDEIKEAMLALAQKNFSINS